MLQNSIVVSQFQTAYFKKCWSHSYYFKPSTKPSYKNRRNAPFSLIWTITLIKIFLNSFGDLLGKFISKKREQTIPSQKRVEM